MKTSSNDSHTSPTNRALQYFVGLAVLYVALIFILPASHATMQQHHLSDIQYRIILLSLSVPSLMTWFAAFLGYAKLVEYSARISKTTDGSHFAQLARGCGWLALSLPIPALISLLLNAVANQWPDFHPTAIIIANYINLLLPLIAFSMIGKASRGLVSSSKLTFSLASSRIIGLLFLTAGVSYCYLIFRQFNLTSLAASNNPYFLPLWLMVISITIPYLYAWFIGLLATYEITLYSRQVNGLLYRRSLRLLIWGLIIVIASSIAIQYLNSVNPRVGHLVLDYRLLVSTLFGIVRGVGFALLALGAIRLKRIEEV